MTGAEIRERIQGMLDPDESLFWFGRPRQGLFLQREDFYLIPLSLCFCGFAIVWECMVVRRGAIGFLAIYGIPFVAFGLFIVIGRFFYDVALRRRCAYGVTDKRIVIASGRRLRTLTSYSIPLLRKLSLVEHSDGTGTIEFNQPQFRRRGKYGGKPICGLAELRLERIEGARSVYERILELQRRASAARPTES